MITSKSSLSTLVLASSLCASAKAFSINAPTFGIQKKSIPSSPTTCLSSPFNSIFHSSSSSSSSIIPTTFTTSTSTSTSTSTTTSLFMARRRGGRPRGPLRTIEVKPPMNNEIKYDTLRVTAPPAEGSKKESQLGIMTKKEALEIAANSYGGNDLILINENSDPPVAKIADYSKYRYEKEKKAKELKKNSKSTEIKEVKMSYKIDVHDYGVRIKNASKFLQQGNRVKCTVQFRGREVQHDNLGKELLERMSEDMTKICIMEGKPKRDGRNLSCILSPRPEITKAANDRKRSEEKAKKKAKLDKKGADSAEKESKAAAYEAANRARMEQEEQRKELVVALGDESTDEDSVDDLLGADDLTDELFG